MRGLSLLLAAVFISAPTPAQKDVELARKGLERAANAGWLAPKETARYGAALNRVQPLLKKLPRLRAQELAGVLHDVAVQAGGYTKPRALTLFAMLEENERYLAANELPGSGTDVIGEDGVLYRAFPGHGLAFHPLGNFALLNRKLGAREVTAANDLAAALVERAVPCRGGLCWEYEFPYSAGKPPWTSSMAQAAAAQALARSGFADEARAAYRAILPNIQKLPEGPWLRLYNWSSIPVLNAQLQGAASLLDYSDTMEDHDARALAERLLQTARALLPRFDTGYWSLYSLAGDESSLGYHDFVVGLLKRLAVMTKEQLWRDAANRFEAYESEPPVLKPDAGQPTLYPEPKDGYLDEASFRFWLSKRSSVTLRVGGETRSFYLGHGPQTITWAPGTKPPGLYRPRLAAVDVNGNRTEVALEPVQVKYALAPPNVAVTVAPPDVLSWQSDDEGTPWLELAVRLTGAGKPRLLELGRQPLTGSAHLELPGGRWQATLLVANSAGRKRSLSLGSLPR